LLNRFLTWTTGTQEHRTTSTEREDKLKPLVQQTTLFKKEATRLVKFEFQKLMDLDHLTFPWATCLKWLVLDNTINKVAEEVLSPEELEERQLKIQEMSKEAKKKNGKKIVPVSSTSDSESEDGESESVQEIPRFSLPSSLGPSLRKSVDREGLCSILGGEEGQNISARESDYNDYSYGVEYARSGRALCRTCDSLIPNRQKYYHHLECYLPPEHVTFERLSISSDLSRADRRLVTARLRER
ncbi:hypothetical protein pdam_00016793, partial [Pocillopora damicornis]